MKTWQKKYGGMLHKYRRDIVEAVITVVLFAFIFAYGMFLRDIIVDGDAPFWKSLAILQEPKSCALCGNGKGLLYHAPVLVNLSTGEVGELRVYDPDLYQNNKLAENQSTGTFCFMGIANLMGYRDTSNHTCYVTVPQESAPIDPSHFCDDCLALLSGTDTAGYILADIYTRDGITTYTIEDGAVYIIRDYTVSISAQEESGNLSINVTGSLFMENG